MITSKMKKGTKLVIIGNSTNHNIPIGTKIVYKQTYPNSGYGDCFMAMGYSQYISVNDVRTETCTVEELETELFEAGQRVIFAKNEVEVIKAKIEYLREVGGKEFKENEFIAYNTLKALENSSLSTIEKAIRIASLFN
jgi:hypothetical protein